MKQLSKEELVLIETEDFHKLACKYHAWQPDRHDCYLYYIRLKNIEEIALGDKFVLGEFINKVRKWCREEVV